MKSLSLILTLALLGSACSGTHYKDAQDEETINADFGSTDKQRFVKEVVDDLLGSPSLSYYGKPDENGDTRIVAVMGGIANRTSEHIDTRIIADGILQGLLGKMRFVADAQGQNEIGERVRFEQGSGRVDPAKAAAFGKQLGAQVILYGDLASIEKVAGRRLGNLGNRTRDVYYQFVMKCVDTNTAEILWTHEVELRKQQVKSLFGI